MQTDLSDDLLEGGAAIAEWLGGKWTAQRVFNARYLNQLPLRSKPGMKLYAFKSEIEAFLRAP